VGLEPAWQQGWKRRPLSSSLTPSVRRRSSINPADGVAAPLCTTVETGNRLLVYDDYACSLFDLLKVATPFEAGDEDGRAVGAVFPPDDQALLIVCPWQGLRSKGGLAYPQMCPEGKETALP